MNSIKEISEIIKSMDTSDKVYNFVLEILTASEVETLSKRWRIIKMLSQGQSQRQIAKNLQVSLCKVTRGAKILKNKNSVISKIIKENNNESIN